MYNSKRKKPGSLYAALFSGNHRVSLSPYEALWGWNNYNHRSMPLIEKSIQVPTPLAPHPDTLADPRLIIETQCGLALICYCPRNQVGAVFETGSRVWTTISPVRFDEFVEALAEDDYIIGDREGREVWAQRIQAVILAFAGDAANDPETERS